MKEFELRLTQNGDKFWFYYKQLYGDQKTGYHQLIHSMREAYNDRSTYLKNQDKEKQKNPNWIMSQNMTAVMMYLDLFAGDLPNMLNKVAYLRELGINYVHLLPFLETRQAPNDGGYAVVNYKEIENRFGTMKDFEKLILEFRKAGIYCCCDFVLNHTAKEHEWAKKASKGEKYYQDLYLMYENEDIPKEFEKTVPEVLPLIQPHNFTYYNEFDRWVFTSFNEYQWDLNYKNPNLLRLIIENMLYLANKGVDILRLDAIPFMWKELNTNCRNLKEIHILLKIFHLAIKIVCPSVILKGEAIVEPEEIVKYFGTSKEPECQIMYNASYMVNLWNSLATRDVRLMVRTLQRSLKIPDKSVWINYIRCHDDIGWGFDEGICWELGFDPYLHKQFLIEFYKGDFNGSFSSGQLYEFNPSTLDARISGTTASLCGYEKASSNKDNYQMELAIKRILLMQSMILSATGIPMLYSGDELGIINDYTYETDMEKAEDSRWIHRPRFNWEKAKARKEPGTLEYTIFESLKKMIGIRTNNEIFASDIPCHYIEVSNTSIFTFYKEKNHKQLLVAANFSEDRQFIHGAQFKRSTLHYTDLLSGKEVDISNEVLIGPYEVMWLYAS